MYCYIGLCLEIQRIIYTFYQHRFLAATLSFETHNWSGTSPESTANKRGEISKHEPSICFPSNYIPNKNFFLCCSVNGGKNLAMSVVCVWWQHRHLCISVGVHSLTHMYTGSNMGGNLSKTLRPVLSWGWTQVPTIPECMATWQASFIINLLVKLGDVLYVVAFLLIYLDNFSVCRLSNGTCQSISLSYRTAFGQIIKGVKPLTCHA